MGKMMNRLRKKGVFFTFIAMGMMTIFILLFTSQADVSLQKDNQAVKTRINTINDYVNDLEGRYFESVLRASTYKSILSLVFYINETGAFLEKLNASFQEVLINGTINNVPIDSITKKNITQNNTLTYWSNELSRTANDTLNVNTTIVINNATIFQKKPWEIDSVVSINYTVKSDVAEWTKEVSVATSIGIEGFYDPYYIVNTGSLYTNQIKMSSVEFNKWSISQTREHLRNGTYVHWENSDAPNFLMRFDNKMEKSSCCGIESLVNPNAVSPSDQIESYVDYLFWTHQYIPRCVDLFNINNPDTGGGLWDEFAYFKLDFSHFTLYNITSQDAVLTC